MSYKDPQKQRDENNAWRRRQRLLNTPWARKKRESDAGLLRERYWTDPEYRAAKLVQAAAATKKRRERLKREKADRKTAAALRLVKRAGDFTRKGYSGPLGGGL